MTAPAQFDIEVPDRNEIVIVVPGPQGPTGSTPPLTNTTPATTSSITGAAGSDTNAARADHRHGFVGGNPAPLGTMTPGTASAIARSDHVHPTTGLVTTATKAIFVSPTKPASTTPHLWVQTGLGPSGQDFTFWIEDGV